MSKVERVWISESFNNTRIYARLRLMLHGQPELEETDNETQRLIAMEKRYKRGEGLRQDEVPTRFCGRNSDTRIKSLSDFFFANGYFVVSESCADVFRRFDLGTGGLYPVEIFQGDCKNRVDGSFFLLNFGCRKQAFLPEESVLERFDVRNTTPVTWAPFVIGDDDCAVSQVALEGCDLWIDPLVPSAFFLSDALVQALREAKVTRTIPRARCRVVRHGSKASSITEP